MFSDKYTEEGEQHFYRQEFGRPACVLTYFSARQIRPCDPDYAVVPSGVNACVLDMLFHSGWWVVTAGCPTCESWECQNLRHTACSSLESEHSMDRGVYAIVSGAIGQERRMDVAAQNLSNAQTVGYKREKTLFSSVFSKSIAGTRSHKSQGDKIFNRMNGTFVDWRDGSQRMTGKPTDVALEGNGFFAVKTPGGTEYTRSGNFLLNQKRQLVTLDGMPVLGQSGPITVPPGKLMVDRAGGVTVEGAQVDTLRIVEMKNLSSAVRAGERFQTKEKPQTVTSPTVIQGSLEESNVNAIEDFVSMIELSRQYEAAQKVVQSMDEATRLAVNELGRPA